MASGQQEVIKRVTHFGRGGGRWGVADDKYRKKRYMKRKHRNDLGVVSRFIPQNWCQMVVDFTGFHFHASSHFIWSPLTKHTHTLASSDPGENWITVVPVPLPLPIGWEVWDMLIKPELIKCSLGLWVSLPLTSLTAVSVRHLQRLINKKALSRLWINAY